MMDENEKKYQKLTLLPRRWFPLPRLDSYILREFLIKYSVLLLVFIILFMLSDVYREISDFLDHHVPWQTTVMYFLYKLPRNIRFILPITMLLGCMWTMATFGKNMEITAMRASGVSLFRCGGSIMLVGLIVTFLNIYFNENMVPAMDAKAERLFEQVVRKRVYTQSLLAYRSTDQKRQWLFQAYSAGEVQKDVNVKMYWTRGMVEREIFALPEQQMLRKIRRIFPYKAAKLLGCPRKEMLEKVSKELVDRKIDISASEAEYFPAEKCWRFRSGSFLSFDRNDDTAVKASMGTSAIHDPVLYKEMVFPAAEIPETPADIVNSIKEKEDLPSWVIWDLLHRNKNLAERVKAIYRTVFYYRLAFPWACFIAVFLGIPLATKNERTGSLMAIITAVVLIVGYIVTAQIFLVLGKAGILNPVFAGVAPTVLFIISGVLKIVYDRN